LCDCRIRETLLAERNKEFPFRLLPSTEWHDMSDTIIRSSLQWRFYFTLRYFGQIYDAINAAIFSQFNPLLKKKKKKNRTQCARNRTPIVKPCTIRLPRRRIYRVIFANAFLPRRHSRAIKCRDLHSSRISRIPYRASGFVTFSYRARGVGGLHVI